MFAKAMLLSAFAVIAVVATDQRDPCVSGECPVAVDILMQTKKTKLTSDLSEKVVVDNGHDVSVHTVAAGRVDVMLQSDDKVNEDSQVGFNCAWTRQISNRYDSGDNACGKKCREDLDCYGYEGFAGFDSSSALLERGSRQNASTKQPGGGSFTPDTTSPTRRRRCKENRKSSSSNTACKLRCEMTDLQREMGMRWACEGQPGLFTSIVSGETCTQRCAENSSPCVDGVVPGPQTCADGALFDYNGVLTVTVKKATNLEDKDWGWNGDSDAYVILHMGAECSCSGPCPECRTRDIESHNPVWQETFTFTTSSQATKLELEVKDADKWLPDEELGWVEFDLSEIIQNGAGSTEKEFAMQGNGKLFVTLSFAPAETF